VNRIDEAFGRGGLMTANWMLRGAAVAGALCLALPTTSWAITQQGTQMMKTWAQSDRCVAAANKQYPDYTAEALAKRDQALQQCLSNSLLAPRAPLTPQQGGQ
jgi:hypothetical protein